MDRKEFVLSILKEKLESFLGEKKAIEEKISMLSEEINIGIGHGKKSSLPEKNKNERSVCQERVIALLKERNASLTQDELGAFLLNKGHKYSSETLRTELSKLKGSEVEYDKIEKRYSLLIPKEDKIVVPNIHSDDKNKQPKRSTNKRLKGEFIVLGKIKESANGISYIQLLEKTEYLESTFKTYIRSLKQDGCITKENDLFFYVNGLEGIDINQLEEPRVTFLDIVESNLASSRKSMSPNEIYNKLLGTIYFEGIKNPKEKVSTAFWHLKKANRVKIVRTVGRTKYYRTA